MGGLAGYITEKSARGPNREQFHFPAAAGDPVRFCTGDAVLYLCGKSENNPITQQRGERVLTAALIGHLSDRAALRAQLRRRGHTLYTEQEAELLLTSYIEWGTAAPEHFSGDFALAVWDGEALFLARSRSGRKALFYRTDSPAFAADPAVLFAHQPLRLSSEEAVRLLCPREDTVCEPILPEGIKALQPGEFLLWQQGKEPLSGFFGGASEITGDAPDENLSTAFRERLQAILPSNESPCFLALRESDPLTVWLHRLYDQAAERRKQAIWEDGDGICPDAVTITGEEAALGLTEPVTALGRADFSSEEAAAFLTCRKLRKSFSSAVSSAGGELLLAGRPQPPIAVPSEWLIPELRALADSPEESAKPLLRKHLLALFERYDRLASHAGLRLALPFADPELASIFRRAARQNLAEWPTVQPQIRSHPGGKDWAHGVESRFRALLARADAPIWALCRRDALPAGEMRPEIMAKLVIADHWLEHFKIAPR